jgi:fimbrial chaperone protein
VLRHLLRPWHLVCLTLFGSCLGVAEAGSLSINPIRLDLDEAHPTAAMTLENKGTGAVVVQLRLMRWLGDGEFEHYEPTDDIVATPPIMTVRPGQPQVVRVGLNRAPDAQRELSYRLFLEEVPPPPTAGYQGVQVAIRIGVPVFVTAEQNARAALRWRLLRGKDRSTVTLSASNEGTAHTKLLRVTLKGWQPDRELASQSLAAYLLPGQVRQWVFHLKEPLAEGRVRLSAESDQGTSDVDLDVEAP